MVSPDQFRQLSRRLEEHHALFYCMWQLGRPVMDESIATACVRYNQAGDLLDFAFNPGFWNSCNDEDRAFTIAHECLHVMLRHGLRTKDTDDNLRCNVALDLVVNHALVNTFGFDRAKLTYGKDFCWVDTVFGNDQVPDNLSFEEYFPLVSPEIVDRYRMVDDHASWGGDSEKIVERVAGSMPGSERESLKEMVDGHSAGTDPGDSWRFISVQVKPKRKWETVIRDWAKGQGKPDFCTVEQWTRRDRRHVLLDPSLILPSDLDREDDCRGRVEVWFFQDTSGSCSGFQRRFFTAASSLPKKRFDVKMHCFDTHVYETTIESGKLYGFGGTAFQPIEDYIQTSIASRRVKYPKAVFIITDGYGTHVEPRHPERWHFFLSTNYSYSIPKTSHIYSLKEFE